MPFISNSVVFQHEDTNPMPTLRSSCFALSMKSAEEDDANPFEYKICEDDSSFYDYAIRNKLPIQYKYSRDSDTSSSALKKYAQMTVRSIGNSSKMAIL